MNSNKQCIGCGGPHHGFERGSRQAHCTAWGKICDNCGLINHISRACLKKGIIQEPTVQQGSQATTTTTASNTANNTTLVVKDQAESQEQIAFAGAVMRTERKQVVEEILAPRSRESVQYWREEHQAHIKELH